MEQITIGLKKNSPSMLKKTAIALAAVSMLGATGSLLAATGQLILVNSVGVVISDNTGGSASNIQVVVNDATGPCTTVKSLKYGGVVTVKWDDTKAHTTSQCTDITSVDVSAIATDTGLVNYDSTANAAPPAAATAATNFVAPTTAIANLGLIVTGATSAAMTNSATSWGSALGVAPVFLTTNGNIATTGIMGAEGMAGLQAESLMHKYAIMPVRQSASL